MLLLFVFIMLFLMCISILFAIANVRSEIKSDKHYIVKRLVRDIHEYNHPPSVISVPVAIVYDEGNRQEKSVEPEVSTVSKSDDQDVNAVTTTEATTLTEMTTNKVLEAHFSVSDKINTEPRSEDELIIPVAVIYDEEPKILRSSPKKIKKSESRNKQQSNRKVVKNASQDDIIKEENVFTSQDNKANTKFPKRTQERDPIIPIVQSENYVFSNSGDFHYSYEGGDGTKAFMRGELRSFDDDNVGAAVEGSFSYIGKDGNDYSLTYTADENGYRPVGAHLPTPPPIPPAIARALKYLATKTTPQPVTESL